MKKILTGIIAITLMSVLSTSVMAASDARQKLNNFFTRVNTMQGTFIQQVYDKQGHITQTSRGQLYLSRPGKFRWIYQTPDQQEIISDSRNLWIYDKELDQVTVKGVGQALASTPAALLMQRQIPDRQFRVTEMDDRTSGWNWFYMTPHRPSSDFEALSLAIDNQGNVRQMVMYDHIGQETVLTFNVRPNVQVHPSRFVFRPPAHVDVIGQPR